MGQALPFPLAACEGTAFAQDVGAVVLAIGAVVLWGSLAWLSIWHQRDEEERRWLRVVFGVSVLLGPAAMSVEGFQVETRVFIGVLAVALLGLATALAKRFSPLHGIGAGILGGLLLPLILAVLLTLHLTVGGGCWEP